MLPPVGVVVGLDSPLRGAFANGWSWSKKSKRAKVGCLESKERKRGRKRKQSNSETGRGGEQNTVEWTWMCN